jgi:hypothetical protein
MNKTIIFRANPAIKEIAHAHERWDREDYDE